MGYRRQAIKGVSWVGAFRGVTRVISFLRTAILARLLSPSQFGFFAIGTLVLSLLELVTETGINIVLIQKKENIDTYIDTAWLVSIIRGFLIGGLIFGSSCFIAAFFNSPGALSILVIFGFVPIVRGFVNPSEVKFDKDLRFRDSFYFNTALFSIESVTTIILAFVLHSAVSLAYGLLVGAISEVLMSFAFLSPRPRVRFHKKYFMDIVHHGKWLTVIGVMSYLYQNLDNIVIGHLLGPSPLGIYDVSYRISLVPVTEITDVVSTATFPIYVKISDDLKRLRNAYIKSVSFIFLFSFIFATILFLFPNQIISIVLGGKWLSAAPVLKILGFLGMFRALSISVIHPLYALKKQKLVTIFTVSNLVILAIFIVPFVSSYGIIGAAYAALLGTCIPLPGIFYIVIRTLTSTSHEKK